MSLKDESHYPIASLALNALASAFYCKWNRQAGLATKAEKLYGQALRALQCKILERDRLSTFDTLASISALQRYENILCTTTSGWIHHAGGIARAIEASGPQCFKQYPHKAILDANVYYVIQESHHYRKRPFLTLEQWSCAPVLCTLEEDHFDQLRYLYARSAGFVASSTCFLADQTSERYFESLVEAESLLKDLEAWLRHWNAAFGFDPVERYAPTSTERGILDDEYYLTFSVSYEYPSLLAGLGVNIYRAIKITTLLYLYKMQRAFWAPGNLSLLEPHRNPDVHRLALDICRTLHIHFTGGGLYYVWFLLFCSLCALRGLHLESMEAQWISATLTDISCTKGIALAGNLVPSYLAKWKAEDSANAAQIATV